MMKKQPSKVIIIGAGLAGLAACKQLKREGFTVLILEARNRFGGRVHTNHNLGFPISGGAGWIHGADGNPMSEFAEKEHILLLSSDINEFIKYDSNARVIPEGVIQRFEDKFDELLKQAKDLANRSQQDISLAQAFAELIKPESFSAVEKNLFDAKMTFFQSYIGADDKFLSARHWDQEEVWPGENVFLRESYQPIIEDLARGCTIQFNTKVTKIKVQKNGVEVYSDDERFDADAVLVTLPLGVLKNNAVEFSPPLPERKQKAIESIGMGLLNVTAIKFPKVFWPKASHAIIFSHNNDSLISAFINLHYFTQQPVLLGYCGGETARRLENISVEKLIEQTMENLQSIYGPYIPDPEAYFTTRWASDPFSYGSYSYVAVGTTEDDFEALAAPLDNRLFFAGEATSAHHFATTHGAYLSGLREAERIRDVFNEKELIS